MIVAPRVAVALMTMLAATAAGEAQAQGPSATAGRVLEGEHRGPAGARRYELYVPAGAAHGRPLVVMLHGCTQTAADFARGTRMNALADPAGALVLYPEQPASANPQRCWNWYDPAHQGRDAGEPAILAAMTREIVNAHGVDPRRVYVAGVSAGGAMALTLAANFPELYAAAGVHSGVPFGAARDVAGALLAMRQGVGGDAAAVVRAMGDRRRTVPLLVLHGDADAVVSPVNARAITAQWGAATIPDGLASYEFEAVVARDTAGRNVRVSRFGAARPAPVEEWLIAGLGHAWSGGSAEGTFTDPRGPDASTELLRFLLAHPMPEGR